MRITPASLTINQLFSTNNEQYVVPTYQRRYSWKQTQLFDLIDDIKLIEGSDTHLLGSIVCLTGPHTAGLNKLELVDGQQRLTTILILMECIRQRMDELGRTDKAAEIGRLLSANLIDGSSVRKIALDSIDSEEFENLIKDKQNANYKNLQLATAFQSVREWINKQDIQNLSDFVYRLTNQAIIIRLEVSAAKDAFKLFETINNRGLRLSPTDIVKNFLLGNAARFGEQHLEEARIAWTTLIRHLDGTDSDSFFRYYLTSVRKTPISSTSVVLVFKSVFMSQVLEAAALPERHSFVTPDDNSESESDDEETAELPEELELNSSPKTISFKDFLTRLVLCAKEYGELTLSKTSDTAINSHLRNLKMIKASQTYGFLMYLRAGGCSDTTFRQVLRLTESFILRRHICRERSNETEALFARLCSIDPIEPINQIKDEYRELSPSDDKFEADFASTNFPATVIDRARYCLERIELRKQGEHEELAVLGAQSVHVEHIIPQKIDTKKSKKEFGDWVTYLGDRSQSLHHKYVSRIGNLTLFAGELNIAASNNPFLMKKNSYKKSSITLTKELLAKSRFKFADVDARSKTLAMVAVDLWPIP